MIKQVIVVNMGLNMEIGRIAAQAAHASIKVFLEMGDWVDNDCFEIGNIPSDIVHWMSKSFVKVVVGVDCADQIYDIAEKAKKAGLPFSIMEDSGFPNHENGIATTCIAVGPANSDELDPITGELSSTLEEWVS